MGRKNRTYDRVNRRDHARAFLHAATVFGHHPDTVIGKFGNRSFAIELPDFTGRTAKNIVTFQIAHHTGFQMHGMLSGFLASEPSKALNVPLSTMPPDDDIHLRLETYRQRLVRFQSLAVQPLDFRSFTQLTAALSYGITP